jgi:hypothetical protein
VKTPAPKPNAPAASVKDGNPVKFTGTSNQRELRAIHAMLCRPMPREHLDKAVGCSNGPDLVHRLRQNGLDIHCEKVPDIDRDGKKIQRGVFDLTEAGRRAIHRWQKNREGGV